MGLFDKHLPHKDDNKGIGPQADVSARERKEIAKQQGRVTKDEAKAAKAKKN